MEILHFMAAAASISGALNIGYDCYFLALPHSHPPLPKRQPRSFITYDISRVQDHNVIHLENADEKVDLVPRSGKL